MQQKLYIYHEDKAIKTQTDTIKVRSFFTYTEPMSKDALKLFPSFVGPEVVEVDLPEWKPKS